MKPDDMKGLDRASEINDSPKKLGDEKELRSMHHHESSMSEVIQPN
jgi:hypothetical protein